LDRKCGITGRPGFPSNALAVFREALRGNNSSETMEDSHPMPVVLFSANTEGVLSVPGIETLDHDSYPGE
jgi:hypothetical protein